MCRRFVAGCLASAFTGDEPDWLGHAVGGVTEVWTDAIPQRNCGRFSRPSPLPQTVKRTANGRTAPPPAALGNTFYHADFAHRGSFECRREHLRACPGRGEAPSVNFLHEESPHPRYHGAHRLDASQPDGTPHKLVDSSRSNALGWRATTGLREGVARAYASFLAKKGAGTLRT